MDRRTLILNAARNLTLERGIVPSLNNTASAAGVSKGGLIHYFPSRAALVQGLAIGALEELDAAMRAASIDGRAAEVWLRLSVPTGDDVALFRALVIAHRAVESPGDDVAVAAQEAGSRWEAMIQKETGDATRARVIRLVGDGLAANMIAGIEPAPTSAQLDTLLDALIPRPIGASQQ
ncbi:MULTISPECIES: TetR/AcrR family transcriptional regulator [Cryobacterium]|uniref:TetR/AcrR family transcriptional regulator n=1 Tax=Cryobacterium breve TaxID=1259258 RepID=A0ABY2J126_9MICO|nr:MULTISPECIES: TetR/AcrR family transcriptional regulator [Cryobacterium]TFC96795.1 TetR/AcrR family transcriptional regulator [Cryobacterium sp. TmT3-12]TFC97408.1 TetR/AcrR family transcriptional regulator [Cryobacterium breve]